MHCSFKRARDDGWDGGGGRTQRSRGCGWPVGGCSGDGLVSSFGPGWIPLENTCGNAEREVLGLSDTEIALKSANGEATPQTPDAAFVSRPKVRLRKLLQERFLAVRKRTEAAKRLRRSLGGGVRCIPP